MTKTIQHVPPTERQKQALAAINALHEASQNAEAFPVVSGAMLAALKAILVDNDQGGNGLTTEDLMRTCGLGTSNGISYVAPLLAGALLIHAPESGVRLLRTWEARPRRSGTHGIGGKRCRYRVVFLEPCQACFSYPLKAEELREVCDGC